MAMMGAFVSQKMDLTEVVTGCEMPNKYYVSALKTGGGPIGDHLFKCTEKSGCCERQFMKGESRPLDITIEHVSPNSARDTQPFLHCIKPCKCTCCCFCRPEMKIYLVEDGQNKHIGTIKQPY